VIFDNGFGHIRAVKDKNTFYMLINVGYKKLACVNVSPSAF